MSENVESFDTEPLFIEAKPSGTEIVIVVKGEFDISGTERFWAYVSEALETHPGSIRLDARGLTFIDSAGLMALVRARDAATGADVAFRVSDPPPALRRIAVLCGLDDLLLAES